MLPGICVTHILLQGQRRKHAGSQSEPGERFRKLGMAWGRVQMGVGRN